MSESTFTGAQVVEIAFQAAGAASAPFMQDHPDYVFPGARVTEGVAAVLADFGLTVDGASLPAAVDGESR